MDKRIYDTSSLDRATAYIITRTARLLRFQLQKILTAHDLTPEQWFLLFRLYEADGRSQTDLADPALNDYPNITRQIDALERGNWVQRRRDVKDRRIQRIFLTSEGQALMETLLSEMVIPNRERLFGNIETEELEQMIETLKKIQENIIESNG